MNNSKVLLLAIVAVLAVAGGLFVLTDGAESESAEAKGAFDEYGYNDRARLFNGPADGVDRALDGKVWGDTMYANDHLVMKWNEAWDACNDAGNDDAAACAGAWLNNEWNGAAPDGSSQVWHYKIIWVGSAGEASEYWQPGGYSVWGNYEVLMDHGVDLAGSPMHTWFAKSTPNGYGSAK